MHIDARQFPVDSVLDTDVCIVGAGPAGIALARELKNQSFRVCLIESGGFELNLETQALCNGKTTGIPYPDLRQVLRRQFGGIANNWGAPIGYKQLGFRCIPLDEIDFEQRDWVPNSGWPFGKTELDPYYTRASTLCNPAYLDTPKSAFHQRQPSPVFDSERLELGVCHYGLRSLFTHDYRQEILQADNIQLLLFANVIEIETNEWNTAATRLKIACLENRQFWVSAKYVILAAGGIENARLLLASNHQQPAGIGNQHDVVGRYFMEHPVVSLGHVVQSRHILSSAIGLCELKHVGAVPTTTIVKLSPTVMRQQQLMSAYIQLFPRPLKRQAAAIEAVRSLLAALQDGRKPEQMNELFKQILSGLDYLAASGFWAILRELPGFHRSVWDFFPLEKRRFSRYEVLACLEQSPDPDNRVMLSKDCDRFGKRLAELRWHLNDHDRETLNQLKKIWCEEILCAGISGSAPEEDVDGMGLRQPGFHHMGTTRMHLNPRHGVVDAHCKVHGVNNLFVVGSSVFPTAGSANPTLTILALAIRLADHIKSQMYQPNPVFLLNQPVDHEAKSL